MSSDRDAEAIYLSIYIYMHTFWICLGISVHTWGCLAICGTCNIRIQPPAPPLPQKTQKHELHPDGMGAYSPRATDSGSEQPLACIPTTFRSK